MDIPQNNDPTTIESGGTEILAPGSEAIDYLIGAIGQGTPWHLALLRAVALWNVEEETTDGLLRRYLIAGEALDWMLVAERLCQAAAAVIPAEEAEELLFHCKAPVDITQAEFKELVGGVCYHQYLNYFYGVTVEEALFWAVLAEVRKERWVSGFLEGKDPSGVVYQRVYQAEADTLLHDFRKEFHYQQRQSTTLLEMKEFSYWLFKYRLKNMDMSRVASDTRKALDWLRDNEIPLVPIPLL